MDNLWANLLGIGTLLIISNAFLGTSELAAVRTIRAPKREGFATIKFSQAQRRDIFVPAFSALVSGFLVSLSASFLYEDLLDARRQWQGLAGLAAFAAAALFLVITLKTVLKGTGQPDELARDPFSIRAAAEEYSENPRAAAASPDLLSRRLDEWEEFISVRSMGYSADRQGRHLEECLRRAANARGWSSAIILSLRVYIEALRRFPPRSSWPVWGFLILSAGAIGYATIEVRLNFIQSWRPWLAVAVFVMIGAISVIYYAVARGNSARLWHRIYTTALVEAREAITSARDAQASLIATEADRIQMEERFKEFLQNNSRLKSRGKTVCISLGKFQIKIG